MDLFRSRQTVPNIVIVFSGALFLYCVIILKSYQRKPPPTGEPVDWMHLPPRPHFPKHIPIPLPSPTPFDGLDPAIFTTNRTIEDPVILERLYRQLRIVTAFSQNHYKEALGLIGTVQKEMPDKDLVIYDLGIDADTLYKVKKLCHVEVRSFPFDEYPPHVKDLHTYAWKVIIINATLQEFGSIFWADTSIRFKKSLRDLIPYVTRHKGYMTHFHSFDPRGTQDTPKGHIYYFTSQKMFSALGVKRAEYFESRNITPHAAANRQIFIGNPLLQEKLVDPLLACALDRACIAPTGARLGKHRFDASALSLLLYKNLRGEWSSANNDNTIFDELVDIRRTTVDWHLARYCESTQNVK
ncbi:uncharacterized protein LOC129266832 [Lytechinus pictus]|uniref:uncharacterized protein LOC129266832 n=1 Tax=Lytechinus pictus TaxID=7653 RepID=UPI0030BA0F7C